MVKFNNEMVKIMALFQSVTNVQVKDCIISHGVAYFVVDDIKAAIGKNGSKAKRVQNKMKTKVKIFEYSEDPETFIRNMVPHIKKLEINDHKARAKVSPKHKARIIGKNGRNIKVVRKFLDRLSPIKKLTVR